MSNRSPRHLIRANTSNWRSITPLTSPSALPPTRQAHTRALDRAPSTSSSPTSNPKSSRRNAHALASHSRYIERAPPPPPPAPLSPTYDTSLERTRSAPESRERRTDEVNDEAFPAWESSVDRKGQEYVEIGETVYADDLEGDVELDWDDWREITRQSVKTHQPAPEIVVDKGKQNSEEHKAKPLVVAAPIKKTPQRRTRAKTQNPELLFAARVRRDPEARLRLQPVERIAPNTISPYLALPPPLFPCPVHPSPQPHELPLVSRSDWRLSSPLRRYLRSNPPSLYSRLENDTKAQGHNRFVGVGVETCRISKSHRSRDVEGSEPWGWKTKVKESERGGWASADLYRKRCVFRFSFHSADEADSSKCSQSSLDRLITLSRKSDEDNYRLTLARQGTPAERESNGKTLCRAIGTWLTDSSRAEEIQKLRKRAGTAQLAGTGMNGGGVKAIASFRAEDGRELTEDLWDFSA
jgi:hypothetical protein